MRIAAELNAALRRVRTGHINFVRRNSLALIEDFNRLLVIRARVAEDVGEHDHILFRAQQREFFHEERRCADVLQPDGIQHSGSGFIEAGRRIPGHRFFGETFDD